MAAILDCRLWHGIPEVMPETSLGSPAAQEDCSSTIFRNSRTPISSCCGVQPEETEKTMGQVREVVREPQNTCEAIPRFQRGASVFGHTRGTCSHGGVIDYPRFSVSEMHLRLTPSKPELGGGRQTPLTDSLTHSLNHWLTHSLTHWVDHSLTESLTHSHSLSLTLTHSYPLSLTLTHSHSLSLTSRPGHRRPPGGSHRATGGHPGKRTAAWSWRLT